MTHSAPPLLPSPSLDELFLRATSARGAGKKRAVSALWDDAFMRGDTSSLDRLVELHVQHPDIWSPSAADRLSSALSSLHVSGVQWCLSRTDFGGGDRRDNALSEQDRVLLGNAVSHGLYAEENEGGATREALLAVFEACPDVLTSITVSSSARIGRILDAAQQYPAQFATLVSAFAHATPGPGQPGNMVDQWLLGRARNDNPSKAQDFLSALKTSPVMSAALSLHFPLLLPGFTQAVSKDLDFAVKSAAPLSAHTMEQAFGWSGGKAMELAFSCPSHPHSAHAVTQDPEMFESWLMRVASSPSILARLLSKHKVVADAVKTWRSGEGGTALEILIAPRVFYKLNNLKDVLPWGRLERWLDRHAGHLFEISGSKGKMFEEVVTAHFPEWSARRRRQSLLELAKISSSGRNASFSPRL